MCLYVCVCVWYFYILFFHFTWGLICMNRKVLSLNFRGKIKFYQQASYHLLPTT